MAWNDRLREAAYSAPSGARFAFTYENVSKTVEKKTTAFEFPDADGTYVQDLGHAGRRYPLRVFFWGDDCDLEAEAFEVALLEVGTGKLEHPIYGVVDVVPFGTITRRDDLKDAANQAVMEVTFWETIGLVYPSAQTDPASEVLAAVAAYNEAAAAAFEENALLDTASQQANFQNTYQALLDEAQGGLQAIADAQDSVAAQFNAINDSINAGVDILVSQPLTLAFQTLQLIEAPARAAAAIQARLDAYAALATGITSSVDAVAAPINGTLTKEAEIASNTFHTRDLFVSTYTAAPVVAVLNNQFATKTDALEAAEGLLDQLDTTVAWRDANYAALAQVDTGEAYQQLQQAVALAAGFLVELSFSLQPERRIVLDRNRTIVDLAAELYGSVDDRLDFLIASNDLSGSEILELPRGREIVYFV